MRSVAVFVAALLASESLYDQALRLYSQQRYEQAEPILRQAVVKHPRSVPVRFLLGSTLLKLKRDDEALRELKMGNQLNPARADVAKLLASEYLRARQPAVAIEVVLALLRTTPPDEETFVLLSTAYETRAKPGDAEVARRLIEQGLKRYPRSARLRAASRRLQASAEAKD